MHLIFLFVCLFMFSQKDEPVGNLSAQGLLEGPVQSAACELEP